MRLRGELQSQLVTHVNEHLLERLSLQAVAERFYLSRSQINRLSGSPLWEYVTIKRLMAARTMIRRGESAGTLLAL